MIIIDIYIVLSILVLAIFLKTLLQNVISYHKQHTSIEAKVVKIYDKYRGRIYFARGRGRLNHSPRYHITFRLENGKKKVFICPSPQYKWVKLGDVGTLTHQGTRFICFKVAIYRNNTVDLSRTEEFKCL